jgi:radial spoke head protein 4A
MSEQAIPEEIGNQEQTNVIPEVENSGENNGENVVNENAEQDSNAVNNGEKEEKQASEEDENKVEEENNEEKSEEKSEEKTEDKSDEKSEENEVSNDEEKSAEEKPTEDNEEKTEKPVEETVKKITFSIPKECVLTESEELLVAKTFLMKNSVKTNTNTYDHMSQIIMSILDSKIDNAADIFETLSTQLKKKKFVPDSFNSFGEFRYVKETTPELEDARVKMELFQNDNEEAKADDEIEIPDLMTLSDLFEWAGLSIGKEEIFLINASMQKLMNDKGLKSTRFWGKIFGTKKNYYIVEADQKEEDEEDNEEVYGEDNTVNPGEEENIENENENKEEKNGNETENVNNATEVQESQIEEPEYPVPKIKLKKPNPLSKEIKSGINKYMYYVCNNVGGPWYKLADVIPEKLQISRKIRKYFTGDLNHEIISYPPFDGTEAQYLRCQIARISAGTAICPTGYYVFDTEDGEPDESEGPQSIIVNSEYEVLSNDQLLDISNWVHHVPYILPQGRTSWENPFGSEEDEENEEEGSEEEASEEENETERVEPETGPQLLTPISQDEENEDIPAWVSKFCSRTLAPQFNPVCISSTRWPGAHTVALADKFTSIYIGDGMKYSGNTYLSAFHIPQPMTAIMTEYQENDVDKDITEQIDPTVEEERIFEEEQAEKLREKEEEEEGSEEEEEEGREEE